MMNLINCISLFVIFSFSLAAVLLPQIKLPRHFDLIIWGIVIGSAALFINTVLGENMYGQYRNAEIIFRAFFAGATVSFVWLEYKRGVV